MSDSHDNSRRPGALRLVRPEPAERVAAAVDEQTEPTPAPAPKSRIGLMMTAWADAIDCDVKLLLDL